MTSAAPASRPRRVLTARSPEDVLAAVPVVLGFEPSESVVMLTFGGAATFHARVDLPPPREVGTVVSLLLEPARRHGVTRVVFVCYCGDGAPYAAVVRALRRAFTEAGIDVVEVLRAHQGRWWSGTQPSPRPGVPYDTGDHRFRAQAVVDGIVVHPDRASLAALLEPVPAGVAETAAALGRSATSAPYGPSGRSDSSAAPGPSGPSGPSGLSGPSGPSGRSGLPGPSGRPAPRGPAAVASPPDELAELVAARLDSGRFTLAELARVLLGLTSPLGRDAAWSELTRDRSPAHVALWVDAVQRSPDDLVAGPACVLALAAWLAGSGALAWCAVDRCRERDPHNTLAALVADLLAQAVPPTTWPYPGQQEAG